MQCPAYAHEAERWSGDKQLTCNDGSESSDSAIGLSPIAPEQLQLEGVKP